MKQLEDKVLSFSFSISNLHITLEQRHSLNLFKYLAADWWSRSFEILFLANSSVFRPCTSFSRVLLHSLLIRKCFTVTHLHLICRLFVWEMDFHRTHKCLYNSRFYGRRWLIRAERCKQNLSKPLHLSSCLDDQSLQGRIEFWFNHYSLEFFSLDKRMEKHDKEVKI